MVHRLAQLLRRCQPFISLETVAVTRTNRDRDSGLGLSLARPPESSD